MILHLPINANIVWDVNPELFILGPVRVRWYGLFFAGSFLLSFCLMRSIFHLESKLAKDVDSLFIYVLVGTIIGARLGHCLFYNPSYYLSNPIEILMVWQGGLASHGAVLGILLAIFLYSRRHPGQSFLWVFDRVAIVAGLNGFLIRIGNLFNSEIIGTETTLPWAFVFANIDSVPRHPVQLYESLTYGLIFIVLIVVYSTYRDKLNSGFFLGLLFVLVFTARFLLEFVKMRQAEYSSSLPISVGQMLSIPFVIAGIILLTCSRNIHDRQDS